MATSYIVKPRKQWTEESMKEAFASAVNETRKRKVNVFQCRQYVTYISDYAFVLHSLCTTAKPFVPTKKLLMEN